MVCLQDVRDMNLGNHQIKKNLEPLHQISQRKKFAQKMFYESTISPLARGQNELKRPIHLRLGIRKRKYQYIQPNSVKQNIRGGINIPNHGKFQKRLELPKNSVQNPKRRLILKRYNNGKVESLYTNKKVPCNLTVQVQNLSNFQPIHSLKNSLDTGLQQEIAFIQKEHGPNKEMIPNLPIHLGSVGITKITVNNRFNTYP